MPECDSPTSEQGSLSLILPVHNQADHIAATVAAASGAIERFWGEYEIVLVVNNSQDPSAAVCRDIATRIHYVQVIELDEGGWGRAVRTGLDAAHGDVLCYANSARLRDETLALMLSYARAYPDVVLKVNRRVRDSLRRRLGSLIYNLEARALYDLAVWDVNGTPKLFPRKFEGLLELRENGDLIDLEFAAICRIRRYPVIEVPILDSSRNGGKSTTNLRSAVDMYVGALRSRRAITSRARGDDGAG